MLLKKKVEQSYELRGLLNRRSPRISPISSISGGERYEYILNSK